MSVQADAAGAPRSITLGGRRVPVTGVLDTWLVEDEWWRKPIARKYLRVQCADERVLTLFHDRIEGGWYLQRGAGSGERGAGSDER